MNRIPIDLIMLLSLLLAAHQNHFQLKLGPIPHEPPPVTCNAQMVCK